MLFDEYLEDVEIWRLIGGSDYADPSWQYISTIKGRFEPVQGLEMMQQNQNFSDVTDMFLSDYGNRSSIKAGDGLWTRSDNIQRRVVGEPEDWKWDLISPHFAAKCQRAQWDIA